MGELQAKSYNALDIMKFIASILVICIHVNPLATYNNNLNFILSEVLAKIAVPLFFTASSYLFFKKIYSGSSKNKPILLKYLKRILTIYIVWSIIYSFATYGLIKSHGIVSGAFTYLRNFIFDGSYFHLWYLTALIFSVLVVYFLLKYISIKKILLTSFLFYLIGSLGDTYYGIVQHNGLFNNIFQFYTRYFISTRNGLFFGFVFVAIGAYLAKNPITPHKTKSFLLISVFLLLAEAIILRHFDIPKDENMYLALLPVTYFLFQLLLNINIKDRMIYKYFRDSSLIIYCSHPLFLFFIPRCLSAVGLTAIYDNSIIRFLIITSFSLIFSFVVLLMVKSKYFKWLKVLY